MVRINQWHRSAASSRAPALSALKGFTPLEKTRSTSRPQRRASLTGFTLIELLVVTAIIVVVSSVVLASNNRFGGVVQLENLAYDIALSIRQAQVYGIAVQKFGTNCSAAGAKCYASGYGVHFNSADPQQYELYADVDKDGLFTVSENLDSQSPYIIRNGFKISGLCAPQGTDAATCTQISPVSQIDIVFVRPEPNAYITTDGGVKDSARIILRSPRGDVMSIVVEQNGQIAVRRESAQ